MLSVWSGVILGAAHHRAQIERRYFDIFSADTFRGNHSRFFWVDSPGSIPRNPVVVTGNGARRSAEDFDDGSVCAFPSGECATLPSPVAGLRDEPS